MLLIVVIVVGLALAPLIYLQATAMEISVEKVALDIRGDVCNVTVNLNIGGTPGEIQSPLTLRFGNRSSEFSFSKGAATGTIDEEELSAALDKGKVVVDGALRVDPIPFDLKKSRKVDVSFVSEALRTINASNVTLTPTLTGNFKVSFSMTADIDDRLELSITDTQAEIRWPFGGSKCTIMEMTLGQDGASSAVVNIPTLTFITMALWGKEVTLRCFGIEAQVVLPFF